MTNPTDPAGASAPDRGEPIFALYRFRQMPVIFVPVGPTPNLSYFVAAAHAAIRQLDAQRADEEQLLTRLVRFASPWGLRLQRTDRPAAIELEVERGGVPTIATFSVPRG